MNGPTTKTDNSYSKSSARKIKRRITEMWKDTKRRLKRQKIKSIRAQRIPVDQNSIEVPNRDQDSLEDFSKQKKIKAEAQKFKAWRRETHSRQVTFPEAQKIFIIYPLWAQRIEVQQRNPRRRSNTLLICRQIQVSRKIYRLNFKIK